jgi:serine/threonine protein kinase
VIEEERDWIGRTIDDRYRIVRQIGDGGMGAVYEAEHLALGKRVALKLIHKELLRDEEVLARFEREARATAAIEHMHVTSAMDFGRLPDGGAYLVVQLVHGLSIRQRIEAGPISWREACLIGAQIADALNAIHGRGFIHRDLTCDNVLLTTTENGSPFAHVLDLGVAGLVHEPSTQIRLTEEGHIVGTPGYMPPEQALGQKTGPRADLYSLGVLLWEMCMGRPLYAERELTQILARQLTEAPPRIPQLAPTAPPDLARLIDGLLARSPGDRPSDAAAVRDALRRFASQSPLAHLAQRYAPLGMAGLGAMALVGVVSVAIAFGLSAWSGLDDPMKNAPMPEVASVPQNIPLGLDPMDSATSAAIDQMLGSRWRAQRRSAAELVREARGVPAWAVATADLELSHTCAERRDALERLENNPSSRAIVAIDRLRNTTTGCGRDRATDCYQCVRAEIERAHAAASHAP